MQPCGSIRRERPAQSLLQGHLQTLRGILSTVKSQASGLHIVSRHQQPGLHLPGAQGSLRRALIGIGHQSQRARIDRGAGWQGETAREIDYAHGSIRHPGCGQGRHRRDDHHDHRQSQGEHQKPPRSHLEEIGLPRHQPQLVQVHGRLSSWPVSTRCPTTCTKISSSEVRARSKRCTCRPGVLTSLRRISSGAVPSARVSR